MDFLANGFEGFCEALDNVKTPVLFCERFDEKSDLWTFSRHNHNCIELVYFLYGGGELEAGGRPVHATLYDIVIYPKGMYHAEFLKFNHHHEIYCVWADIPGLDIPNAIRIQDRGVGIKGLLENLHGEYKSDSPCPPLIEHYVKAIAMLIAKRCMTEEQDEGMISRVMMYMRDHMSERITIGQLADMVFVSKSYLSRIFKRQTGMSLIEYLRALRIETAKTILVSSDMSTEEVACAVGYGSSKYFYRAFLAYTGVSPREFRKRGAKD